MNRIDEIIKESIDNLVSEAKYNYRNKFAKMKAAAHAAERNGKIGAVEDTNDLFAKIAAIRDMNKEISAKRPRKINKDEISRMTLNGDDEDMSVLSAERMRDLRDYFNSENEFNRAITPDTFKNADGWLEDRDINDLEY
jgi:hypothetical protein